MTHLSSLPPTLSLYGGTGHEATRYRWLGLESCLVGASDRSWRKRERERFWFGLVCMCVSECWPSALVLSVRERIIFYG